MKCVQVPGSGVSRPGSQIDLRSVTQLASSLIDSLSIVRPVQVHFLPGDCHVPPYTRDGCDPIMRGAHCTRERVREMDPWWTGADFPRYRVKEACLGHRLVGCDVECLANGAFVVKA